MHSKILVVVDMQNDFITGPLGNQECANIVPSVVETIENGNYDHIFVTLDTHGDDYLETQEGTNLPVKHCISGTEGWKIVPDVQRALDSIKYETFTKGTFGSVELANTISQECLPDAEVDIIGVCTDICVVSNAMLIKAVNPEMRLSVISKACAGTTPENHDAAMTTMKNCQIRIV